MRIVAGAWRGRRLVAPAGTVTRPTSERLRQAVFDMLWHAPWGGRAAIEGAAVLDVFAGTGALGLEAMSRGAAAACFIEHDGAALAALRANVAACGAGPAARIEVSDACRPGPGPPADLVFIDPPYGLGLVDRALAGLSAAGRIAPAALIVAELARADTTPALTILAERAHGAGRMVVARR